MWANFDELWLQRSRSILEIVASISQPQKHGKTDQKYQDKFICDSLESKDNKGHATEPDNLRNYRITQMTHIMVNTLEKNLNGPKEKHNSNMTHTKNICAVDREGTVIMSRLIMAVIWKKITEYEQNTSSRRQHRHQHITVNSLE